MCLTPLVRYILRLLRLRTTTMGNSNSSQSLRSGRSSRLRRGENGESKNRLSQAISFYQTPPGSLDLRELEQGGSTPRSPSSSNRTSKIASPVSPEKQEPAPRKEWKAGVYSLMNSGSGTVIDLSGGDQRSIIGFPAHHGPNQQVRVRSRLLRTETDNLR